MVAEFAVAEFAAVVGLSTEGGKRLLGEAVELCYRLPGLWARVQAGDLPAWKARRIARETTRLSPEAAAFVDTRVAPTAAKVGPAQLDRIVAVAIGRFMPEEVQRLAEASWDKRHVSLHDQLVSFTGTMHVEADLDIADALDLEAAVAAGAAARADLGSTAPLDVRRAQALGDLARGQHALPVAPSDLDRPTRAGSARRRVVLHVHLSEAALHGRDPVARLERGDGVVSVDHVRDWCGRNDTQVVVQPVLDPDGCDPVDTPVVPTRHAAVVAVRDRTCVFPWCTRPARRCDCDHITPSAASGPTCPCNLAALCRRHHRLKTHSPWTYLALDPGTYLWTSPHGYQLLRDPTGTRDVTPHRPRPSPSVTPADP